MRALARLKAEGGGRSKVPSSLRSGAAGEGRDPEAARFNFDKRGAWEGGG